MIILAEPPPDPQYLVALLIAAPLLGAGIVLSLLITRFSAWYARRWRGPEEEEQRPRQPRRGGLVARLFARESGRARQ
jgi:hypothetical protein